MFRTEIMTRARERASAFGIENVVVATITGASVRAAREAFGPGVRLFAVGNPPGQYDGIDRATQLALQEAGIEVVLTPRTLFQRDPDFDAGWDQRQVVARAYARRFHKRDQLPSGSADLVGIVYNVLNEFLGDGPRVCMEVAVAAADSGLLPLDRDCMAIATPSSYSELPDAALILRPTRSEGVFSSKLRIKDLLLCPTDDDVWFSNGPLP